MAMTSVSILVLVLAKVYNCFILDAGGIVILPTGNWCDGAMRDFLEKMCVL